MTGVSPWQPHHQPVSHSLINLAETAAATACDHARLLLPIISLNAPVWLQLISIRHFSASQNHQALVTRQGHHGICLSARALILLKRVRSLNLMQYLSVQSRCYPSDLGKYDIFLNRTHITAENLIPCNYTVLFDICNILYTPLK